MIRFFGVIEIYILSCLDSAQHISLFVGSGEKLTEGYLLFSILIFIIFLQILGPFALTRSFELISAIRNVPTLGFEIIDFNHQTHTHTALIFSMS